jgi:hypothetical protein
MASSRNEENEISRLCRRIAMETSNSRKVGLRRIASATNIRVQRSEIFWPRSDAKLKRMGRNKLINGDDSKPRGCGLQQNVYPLSRDGRRTWANVCKRYDETAKLHPKTWHSDRRLPVGLRMSCCDGAVPGLVHRQGHRRVIIIFYSFASIRTEVRADESDVLAKGPIARRRFHPQCILLLYSRK